LSLRYYYYSHLNSLHYFRADHLHAALRALVGPRAQTFKVTTSGAEMVGEMVDVVLRMTLREAGRILHRKSGMAEPTKRAPLFNRTPAPPRAQVKLNTNEPAPPSKPRPLSALAQRQDVLLQTRHVLAALGSDVDLRPLFDGLLVPALRSEDAPAGAASASSPFLPLLRVALERSASAAVGASARVADALSESVLQRTVAALLPVLGALLPQFFRATRRGLWQLQQAGAATEPAHKDGGATTSAAVAPLGSATVLLLPRVCPLFPSGAGPVAAVSLCLVSPRVHVRDSIAPSFALAELEAALGELSLNADGAGALPQSEQARLAEATQQQLAATRKGAVTVRLVHRWRRVTLSPWRIRARRRLLLLCGRCCRRTGSARRRLALVGRSPTQLPCRPCLLRVGWCTSCSARRCCCARCARPADGRCR